MSRILLIGGAGFIGGHIAESYVAAGHEVCVIDKARCSILGVRHIQADIGTLDVEFFNSFINDFDVVNHHAAQVDVRVSIESPLKDAEQNILVALKLLAACTQSKSVKSFIFASSGGAINNSEYPESPYGIAKLTVEKYLMFYSDYHGLNTTILRYSNVYGPRQSAGVVPIFIKKMLKDEEVTANGGSQTRDFVYVTDVAEANLEALNEKGYNIYNISSGKSTSISTLAKDLKKILNSKSSLKSSPLIKGEVLVSKLKPTPFGNWKPSTSLSEGLILTSKSFK